MTTIKVLCHTINVVVDTKIKSGTITSDLKKGITKADDADFVSAIDGLESLILGHACAGIDITSKAYVEGIETALEAINNNL